MLVNTSRKIGYYARLARTNPGGPVEIEEALRALPTGDLLGLSLVECLLADLLADLLAGLAGGMSAALLAEGGPGLPLAAFGITGGAMTLLRGGLIGGTGLTGLTGLGHRGCLHAPATTKLFVLSCLTKALQLGIVLLAMEQAFLGRLLKTHA